MVCVTVWEKAVWLSSCFSVAEDEENGSSLLSKGWFENFKKWMIVYVMKGRHMRTSRRRQVYRITCLFFLSPSAFPPPCEKMGDCVSYAVHVMKHTG